MSESVLSLSNVALSNFCTYHVGGKARRIKIVYDVNALSDVITDDCVVIGCGSKLLVSDHGYDGTIVLMRACGMQVTASGVYAYAGTPLSSVARYCESFSKSGLEWTCGIPGSVGGAIKMNAGAFGSSVLDVIEYADVLRDGALTRVNGSDLGLGYRTSAINGVVVGAAFACVDGDKNEIASKRKEYTAVRQQKQPRGFSCGSVFKNGGKPAGWYIQQAGLKGLKQGGAFISDKHANFIINDGFATSKDVYTLIRTAKAEVKSKFGVLLKEEVIYLGEF